MIGVTNVTPNFVPKMEGVCACRCRCLVRLVQVVKFYTVMMMIHHHRRRQYCLYLDGSILSDIVIILTIEGAQGIGFITTVIVGGENRYDRRCENKNKAINTVKTCSSWCSFCDETDQTLPSPRDEILPPPRKQVPLGIRNTHVPRSVAVYEDEYRYRRPTESPRFCPIRCDPIRSDAANKYGQYLRRKV